MAIVAQLAPLDTIFHFIVYAIHALQFLTASIALLMYQFIAPFALQDLLLILYHFTATAVPRA
jgi:hypothetical protein